MSDGRRQEGPEYLLPLAVSRPSEAFAAAGALLEGTPDPRSASIAHQARAIVLRDSGHQAEAVTELRLALRLAKSSAELRRVADVQATLGLTLGLGGRPKEGLSALDQAVGNSRGVAAGRVLTRRGYLLRVLGRYDDALADLRQAITLLHRGHDQIWEARARTHRFLVYSALGQAAHADRDLVVAERLSAATGQVLESAMLVHNRADVAFQAGDLPAALGFLDAAAARYAALQTEWPSLAIDRCAVLLAAGLATEAVTTTEQVLQDHLRRGSKGTETAELLFAAAQAALAAGRSDLAEERAAAAGELFRRHGRHGWLARAMYVMVQAQYDAGRRGARLSTTAARLADQLDELNSSDAPAAHLLAGHLLAADGRKDATDRHLARAARFRHRGPTFGHAAGWLAHALRAEGRGATAATLIACRRGLEAAADHQRSLAAPELRAHAAGYGVELAALAQRHAVRRNDARMLLHWSEQWRASALALPPVRPPDDPELAADLAALRNVVRRLDATLVADRDTDRLQVERSRLESSIRARTRRHGSQGSGDAADPHRRDDVSTVIDGLGEHRLVEITALDDVLYAITVVGRRVRMYPIGPVGAAVRELELALFMLRRLAHGRAPAGALERLDAAGLRLQEVLLGPAAADLDDAPVLIVPPAALHAVPWAMLPALRSVPVVVAPSASIWLRAGRMPAPRHRRVALVVGPGLDGGKDETRRIGRVYPDAVVLTDGAATADNTLAALDGAWTAHIAAHGLFRRDNPLFSAIELDDGPLTLYDLGRLRRAPQRLVLSSCESGVAAPIGTDELLGAVSALVPLGTASLLATVVPVNDTTTAALMVDFHQRLRARASFGVALHEARTGVGDDPVAVATALSFVALGR
ncbi:CHAT domain-containing protein [Kribbella steppae]|uniref:CHAT domain-containing protein n=1 Tax=Kribbella steppae TaxID=2512223 RepID=A0A4R2HF69_9ACTN|nr:CHAT domain-containing protein [Kribbella steppae]TCO26617.1 CHAT domain-containing protein [Kribbella steppae]